MATRAFWEATNTLGILERIEIDDAEFVGTVFRMCANSEGFRFSHSEITSESSDGLVSPFRNNVQIGKLDFFPRIQTLPETNLVNDILGAEDTRFTLRWIRDGSTYWTGYVNNKLISFPESGGMHFGRIRANDFEILKGIDYLDAGLLPTGRQTIIQTIADLFAFTGFTLNIRTATSWITQDTADGTDFLSQIFHELDALRTFGRTGDESDGPISVFRAIEQIGAPALLFKQLNNEIHVDQLTAFDDPANVSETVYDSTGAVVTPTALVSRSQQGFTSVSAGTPAIKITSNNDAYPPLKRVQAPFHHRSKSGGEIEFPTLVRFEGNDSQSFQMPILADGDETIRLTGQVRAFSDTASEAEARVDIQIQRSGLDDYYWNGNDWVLNQATIRIELANAGLGAFTGPLEINTDELPVDADGILIITLASAVTTDSTEYRNPELEITNIDNSTSSVFQSTQSGGYSEVLELEPTWFGDGPNSFSPSALRFSSADSDLTAQSWERRGFTSFRSFHALLLQDVMDLQRSRVRKLEADIIGNYDPTSIFLYDGNQYYYTAGSFSALPGRWSVSLMEVGIDSATDTIEEIFLFDSADRGVAFDSSAFGLAIQNRGFNEQQYITTTSAAVTGTITSIPINPIGNEWIDAGDIFYIYNVVSASLNEFTLAESQLANDTELIIEETTLADTIPANSWVIYTGELISTYLTQSDTSIRIGVNNHDHLTTGQGDIIGTGQGDELVAGFGNKEAQFQGVGAEIAVNKDSIEATVRDVEGNSSTLRLLSQEIVLKVDSNGNIAAIQLDGSADDGSVISITADVVNLNNWTFIEESGILESDNFVTGVSGIQLDPESGVIESDFIALRNGVLEDSEIRNLQIIGTLFVPAGNVEIGDNVYNSPGLGQQQGISVANEGALFTDQGIDFDARAGTASEIEWHDTNQVDDLVSNANLVGEISVSIDDVATESNLVIRAQAEPYDSTITLVANRVDVNAIGIFNDNLIAHGDLLANGTFAPPFHTNADEPDPTLSTGRVIYNTDVNQLKYSNGTIWVAL